MTCNTTQCQGTTVCVESQCIEPTGHCGGFAGLQCNANELCVDDPRDDCDPENGGADCGGVCVPAPSHEQPDSGTPDSGTPQQQPDAGGEVPQSCGGFTPNPMSCPTGYKCVDNPNTCSMAVDCPGICVRDDDVIRKCGGNSPNQVPCHADEICVDNPATASMAVDAQGICIKKTFCGGFASLPCPGAYQCIDDWTDTCDPQNGGADCGGLCTTKAGTSQCAGFAGLQCPAGLRCLDNPADDCDLTNGNADCGGLCVP
ncbi:MAG: hypothetical protein JNK82_05325 [Myxococcaceae bacterium]|nr:hypothetical protein [Myxococcaceae bacterium]